MSINMNTDNKSHYDVFIAGGGIVACTFARLLVDAGFSVAIADAGNFESRRAGENHKNHWKHQRNLVHYGHFVKGEMYRASVPPAYTSSTRNMLNPSQDPAKNLPGAVVAYVVGGMAVHWTCAIPRHNEDLERIKFIPSEDWEDLYAEAELRLNRNTDVFSESIRHKVLKRYLRERNWMVEDTPLAAKRREDNAEFVDFTGADTVLKDLAEPGTHENFTILPQHRVTNLVSEGGRVKKAKVREIITGQDRHISADVFIVAAGWLHTAQILWNSEIHRGENSSLGRYITDHTFTACTVLLKKEIEKEMVAETKRVAHDSVNLNQDSMPVPMKDPPPHMYIPVSKERPWHSMIFRESFQFDPLPEDVDDRRIVDLKWFGMIEPNRENHITFSSENRDMLGMPQPTFHINLSDEDKHRQDRMMAHMQEIALDLGGYLPGPQNDPQKYEAKVIPLGASTHTMGATRMGPDDDGGKTSVVDTHSKVWGFDNLYLGGNNLIPTANASNPTLTSIALAIRAARQIAAQNGSGGSFKA